VQITHKRQPQNSQNKRKFLSSDVDDLQLTPARQVTSNSSLLSGHTRSRFPAAIFGALFQNHHHATIGGAAPFKVLGSGSETIDIILSGDLSSWFADTLLDFTKTNVNRLPVDTGALFALMEGRSILCNQAAGDAWANNDGTRQNLEVVCARVKSFLGIASAHQISVINPGTHDDNSNRWTSRITFCDRVFYGGNRQEVRGQQEH